MYSVTRETSSSPAPTAPPAGRELICRLKQSKLFANHNALGQLTNHNTFSFSEGGPSSNPEQSRLCEAGEKGIVIM